MKKAVLSFIVFVLLAGSVSAISLGSIRYDDPAQKGEPVTYVVNVYNNENHRNDVKVSVQLMDDDYTYRSNTITVPRNDKRSARFILDEDLPKGEYLVKINAKYKGGHRTKYRYLIVD